MAEKATTSNNDGDWRSRLLRLVLRAQPRFAILLLLVAAGCTLRQSYPETQIHGYINGQPFTIQAPKDTTLIGFDASAQTNGSVHVHIDSLQAALNATNLANAANGQAAIISATAQAVNQAFATAASAAAAAAK